MPKQKKSKKYKCPHCGAIINFEDLEEVKDTSHNGGITTG